MRNYMLPKKLHQREFRPAVADRSISAQALGGPAPAETVATYLNKRLAEIGCKHVMAIPGDYIAAWVETLDDPSKSAGLVRVHPNNEMVGTYAADGYGRATGGQTIGCCCYTYGVGSLNAAQAVAGAFAEGVPLVVVAGTPTQAQFNSQRDQGVLWHHMMNGSDTDLRVFQEITAMAVHLDTPANAPNLIDAALTTCITASRPVYIEMAAGLEDYACEPVAGRKPLVRAPLPQSQTNLNEAVDYAMAALKGAKSLVVIGGVEIARFQAQDDFVDLLKTLEAPYLSDLLGKSILSEYRTDVKFSGVYNGRNSQANVQKLVRSADVILMLGVRETDFNFSGVTSADYAPNTAPGLPLPLVGQIEARLGAVLINSDASPENEGELYWGDIQIGPFIQALSAAVKALPGGKLPNVANFPVLEGSPWDIPLPAAYPGTDQVTWDSFKSLLQYDYLTTFTADTAPVLLADTGLTFYSLNNVKVPENGYIAQLAWGAIGYSPGAIGGVDLALKDKGIQRRVISVSGDGAFAESVNAIGTLAEMGQDCVVFVMANGVFAIEQFLIDACAFSPTGSVSFKPLTQVAQTSLWNWVKLAEGFGGVGYDVTTNAELAAVLATLKQGSPPPAVPHGPCAGGTPSANCCQFVGGGSPPPSPSTFTLVAVRNVCKDLPSNTAWKMEGC